MPEGPEVETIRRGLAASIVGQTLTGADVLWERSFPAPADLRDQIMTGAAVIAVDRRAKVLMWHLDNEYSLLFHLKMTGQMVLVRANGDRMAGGHPSESMARPLPDNSTRVVFRFASGDRLFFNDQRKFGWVKLMPTAEVPRDTLVARLGPEALGDDFTLQSFRAQLDRHKRALIKPTILDQATVAGVGNIYADESLHLARIHPTRLVASLTAAEVKRLYAAIRTIIGLGIEHGGTSFAHYVNSLGGKGDYLDHARVFRRDGQLCPVCGTVIEKTRVAGRGTHFCPTCQKLGPILTHKTQ